MGGRWGSPGCWLSSAPPRYINYFSGLLSGAIKMNSHTLFLHHVRVPALPTFEAHGGEQHRPGLVHSGGEERGGIVAALVTTHVAAHCHRPDGHAPISGQSVHTQPQPLAGATGTHVRAHTGVHPCTRAHACFPGGCGPVHGEESGHTSMCTRACSHKPHPSTHARMLSWATCTQRRSCMCLHTHMHTCATPWEGRPMCCPPPAVLLAPLTLDPTPPRIPALPEDLPVHAACLHLWDLVSMSPPPLPSPPIAADSRVHPGHAPPAPSQPLPLCLCSSLTGPGTQKLCITLEPALLLKGDVMVSTVSTCANGCTRGGAHGCFCGCMCMGWSQASTWVCMYTHANQCARGRRAQGRAHRALCAHPAGCGMWAWL